MKTNYAVTLVAAGLFALAPLGAAQTDQTTTKHQSHSSSTQSTSTSSSSTTSSPSAMDQRFAQDAAKGSQAEVQIGQLVQQKASSDAAKQFGQHLVDDHTQALNQLKQIAEQKGITLDTQPTKAQQSEYHKLNGLSGAGFDRELARYEVKDHKKDISEFQREADKGADPDLKNYAQQQITGLQQHLQMAQSLMKNSAESTSNPGSSMPRGQK